MTVLHRLTCHVEGRAVCKCSLTVICSGCTAFGHPARRSRVAPSRRLADGRQPSRNPCEGHPDQCAAFWPLASTTVRNEESRPHRSRGRSKMGRSRCCKLPSTNRLSSAAVANVLRLQAGAHTSLGFRTGTSRPFPSTKVRQSSFLPVMRRVRRGGMRVGKPQ